MSRDTIASNTQNSEIKIGISDIAIYLPRFKIELETIIQKRTRDYTDDTPSVSSEKEGKGKKIETLFRRTLEKTGLLSMHFPEIWEDSVTMAAQATLKLLKQHPLNLQKLRYLVSGTETAVDHSKPLASYVIGILKKAGIALPQSLSTFQTQHACAGGTMALLGISALLGFTAAPEEHGIVVCSDIARYEKATSAEMTQGAGAVAILTETDPKLIELNLKTVGYSSKDVDDFFRPLGSDVAKVKGSFSIRCYMEAMDSALCDHATRKGTTPQKVLEETDLFALHVPYPKLPFDTMKYLLEKYLKLNAVEIEQFLEKRGFFSMIHPASKSGNIYTGSLFMSLAFLLQDQWNKFSDGLVGKTVLMGSYGSGNTMAFISGKIATSAPSVIKNWNLNTVWHHQPATIHDYEEWLNSNKSTPALYAASFGPKQTSVTPNSFYLDRIREDGYREYNYTE